MNPENKRKLILHDASKLLLDVYNFKAPPFEEPAEGYSIPPQILELFGNIYLC